MEQQEINKRISAIHVMNDRVSNDCDPISGRKRQVEWPIRSKNGHPCDATGRKVTLSEFGDWVYA